MTLHSSRIAELKTLSRALEYTFSDLELLNKALTHRSYVNEKSESNLKDNERFEFLGDSVLDLIVSRYMILSGRPLSEGSLSKIRSQIVNEQALADLARSIQLGNYLLLGKGEEGSGGREKSSLLADAFEALIAAVFLDSDFNTTYHTFLEVLKDQIHDCMNGRVETDFKGALLKLLRPRSGSQVIYRVIDESGPDHLKTFTVRAFIEGEPIGVGVGRTKKDAEQQAAEETLFTLRIRAQQQEAADQVEP